MEDFVQKRASRTIALYHERENEKKHAILQDETIFSHLNTLGVKLFVYPNGFFEFSADVLASNEKQVLFRTKEGIAFVLPNDGFKDLKPGFSYRVNFSPDEKSCRVMQLSASRNSEQQLKDTGNKEEVPYMDKFQNIRWSTGLKDSDGHSIHVGDIVQYNPDNESPNLTIVKGHAIPTGLKDADGRDIHVGDIVRCEEKESTGETYTVTHTVIQLDNGGFDLDSYGEPGYNGLDYYTKNESGRLTVIGVNNEYLKTLGSERVSSHSFEERFSEIQNTLCVIADLPKQEQREAVSNAIAELDENTCRELLREENMEKISALCGNLIATLVNSAVNVRLVSANVPIASEDIQTANTDRATRNAACDRNNGPIEI